MIRKVLRLVPEPYRAMVPRYIVTIVLFALAQSAAYVLLVPLLESLFGGDIAGAWQWLAWIGLAVVLVGIGGYQHAVLGIRIGSGMMHSLQTRLGDHIAQLPCRRGSATTSPSCRWAGSVRPPPDASRG